MRKTVQFLSCCLGMIAILFFVFLFPRPFIQFFPEQIAKPSFYKGETALSEKVFFLVLGVDDAGEAGSDRTDAIMLVGLDLNTSAFELVSIPRDLMINDPKNTKDTIKINSVYKSGGLEALKNVIENLMTVQIEKYAVIDYSLFKYLGDLVGPIEIKVDESMHYEDHQQSLSIHFEPGVYEMYGEDLLNYVRFRDDSKGDLGRIERQKNAIKSIFIQFKNKLSFEFIENEFKSIIGQMETDFTTQDIIYTLLSISDLNDVIFFNYPYKISSDGSIHSDDTRMTTLIDDFKSFSKTQIAEKEGTINVINCTSQTARVFSIVNYNILSGTGLNYFLINEPLNTLISETFTNNTIMVFSDKHSEKSQAILQKFQSLYQMDFSLIDTNHLDHLILYYQTVQELTQTRQYYPTPLQAIVFIKQQ